MDDNKLTRIFAALAGPTRRDIVTRLAVSDATVGELAAPYDVSIQAVAKHIKVLADAGLVTQRKEARRRPCHLEGPSGTAAFLQLRRRRDPAELQRVRRPMRLCKIH